MISASFSSASKIEGILPQIGSDSLVLCDIDECVVEPAIGQVPVRDLCSWTDDKKNEEQLTEAGAKFLQHRVRSLRKSPAAQQVPPEGEITIDMVKEIQRVAGDFFYLTSRPYDSRDRTYETLERAQVVPKWGELSSVACNLYRGILFTNGALKGKNRLLPNFFEEFPGRRAFRQVVVIDDKPKNLFSMQRACAEEGIESFVGIRYIRSPRPISDSIAKEALQLDASHQFLFNQPARCPSCDVAEDGGRAEGFGS